MDNQISASIQEVLAQFKTGDFSNYKFFYNSTNSKIHQLLAKKLASNADAVKVLPVVYDNIYKRINELTDASQFYIWADVIVMDTIYEQLGKNYKKRTNKKPSIPMSMGEFAALAFAVILSGAALGTLLALI